PNGETSTKRGDDMRHCTDIIGEIEIRPALNRAETTYLRAFAASRRWWRPPGPYHVPAQPEAAEGDHDEVLFATTEPAQPGLRCPWLPDPSGQVLVARRGRAEEPVLWLRYLIAHFLRPGARAKSAGGPAVFAEFTFDHILNGVVAASCVDTGRLALVRVSGNQ